MTEREPEAIPDLRDVPLTEGEGLHPALERAARRILAGDAEDPISAFDSAPPPSEGEHGN